MAERPIEQPYPDIGILQEEYLLVQAWKKTVAHLRAHNWFADTLAIDQSSAELPWFLKRVAKRLADPDNYSTRPLRLVPAPKGHPWQYRRVGGVERWEPKLDQQGLGPRIRPLAHVDLEDQVAATAIMLCLADRVETIQGDPSGDTTDAAYRRRVVSYGNRLLCDKAGHRLSHRWGSGAMYRGYFRDYQAFLSRPDIAASSVPESDHPIVIVQSDLQNFYDRVSPGLLANKVKRLKRDSDSRNFFQLAERALSWNWHPRDEAAVDAYAKRERIADFSRVALPQGLAAAGFFSNVVLLGFDRRLRRDIGSEVFPGALLVDVARYVDDLRIVLQLDTNHYDLMAIEDESANWLDSLLEPKRALRVSRKKTRASVFGIKSDRPTIRQGERIARIQRAVSGGFDVTGGESILEAVRGLLQTQRMSEQDKDSAATWPLTPVPDVPDATAARFGAARYRRVYRWLRPLAEVEATASANSQSNISNGSAAPIPFLTRSRNELDNDAEVFAAKLIEDWVDDPSNIRLLRIAFDIWPSASQLQQVLGLLIPYAISDGSDEAHQIARYCLGDLFRAGATETGIVRDPDELAVNIDEYRSVLRSAAEQIVTHAGQATPWYLRQQALLFLATCIPRYEEPIRRSQGTRHHAALIKFLRNPASASSPIDFATFSVLARRSFAQRETVEMLAETVDVRRLRRIAQVDPNLTIALVNHEPTLDDHLPEHMKRDLCLASSVPSGKISLADLVLGSNNPFRDELALLQFALKALDIVGDGALSTIAPVDLEVVLHDQDPWRVRQGDFELKAHRRNHVKSSIYSPPSWCAKEERWRFQLGYLLRFILTGEEDFTASARPTSWREKAGHSYRPVPMPWSMRRYGLYSAHEAFGDRWLPVTEWTTNLLLDLLAWPGARRPKLGQASQGAEITANAIRERIRDIEKLQGPRKSELLLRVEAIPPDPTSFPRSLRTAVVQTLLPDRNWFTKGNETLTLAQRRQLRRHLSAALEAIRTTLRLRRTRDAESGGLDFLVFPELTVHVEDLWLLKRFAITHQTMILAGLVYHEAREGDGQELVNSAVWLIPEQTTTGGRQVRVLDQGKHNLSPIEANSGLSVRSHRTSQWMIGYPWSRDSHARRLWLTASVCYDATNFALATELTGRSDVYVVVARNQDVETFDRMSQALNYHTFQMVIIANDGNVGGSNAYAPYKDRHDRRIFHFYGQEQATIAHLDIDPIDEFLQRLENARGEDDKRQFKRPPAIDVG